MNTNIRNLRLDVCDYSGNVICNLYDNLSDTSGRATDVFVTSERNGWKELSFTIPSVIYTDEGMEDNYRLKYLIADYRIRLMDDYETDWYLISEPKITHDRFSKNISVIAGHISQLLKNKKMDLEFSDDEGNNVGTARELLDTILEGTGWTSGEVTQFMERDEPNVEKVRSLVASAKSGAFKMIADMCELFDAKPLYHGDSQTVDILPINPFSEELNEDGTPTEVVEKNIPVLELHYDRNTHEITRTLNTDNLITKLYAYGSYGDQEGMCSLQLCEHNEYNMTLTSESEREYYFTDGVATYYFTATNARNNDKVIWSELDTASRSYVWNDRSKKAYRVYKAPKSETRYQLTPTVTTVRNYFSFIMDFSYFDSVNLLTDEMFQAIAEYQRTTPSLLALSEEKQSEVVEVTQQLSEIAESNTGFLKLNVVRYESDNDYLKLVLDSNTPVVYRSDYDEPRRRLFAWYVADELKDNGDPVSGMGSVVYAINTSENPVRWRKAFVKLVNGEQKNYVYSANQKEDPTNLVLWIDRNEINNSNFPINRSHFYLFCTNSMSGKLGAKESEAEALARNLQQTTKQVTEIHPTFFGWDNDPMPDTVLVQNGYGWFYRSFRDSTDMGNLYFCYGLAGDSVWRRVYVAEEAPQPVAMAYFFNSRNKLLYHGETQQGVLKWVEIGNSGVQIGSQDSYYAPDTEAQALTNNFSKVVFYCLKRDRLYKGLYEKYYHIAAGNIIPGNYAFVDEYGFSWMFTTDKIVSTGKRITLDTTKNNVYQGAIDTDIVKAELKGFDTIEYPLENELSTYTFSQGTIDLALHVEANSEDFVRSNNVTVYYSTRYDYSLPSGSYVLLYDANRRFLDSFTLNTSGYFTTTERTRYLRLVCPSIPTGTHYIRVHDYLNRMFVSRKQYTILGKIKDGTLIQDGEQVGINSLISNLVEYTDDLYLNKMPAYLEATEQILEKNNTLSGILGDIYREGWWQEERYIEGEEVKLYRDATEILDKAAQPEKTYSFTFLDLYGTDQGLTADDSHIADWPDINISYAAHLVDEDIGTNEWAYIDKLHKCYDQPWKTTIEIDTNLSLINQHTFTDVMSHIAEVAKETKANQTLYKRASNISGSGKVATDKLEGAIKANVTLLSGGGSNWYTDPKGNIVMESADGNSAMMLTGAGWMLSNTKDRWGDWEWRNTMTGDGMTADAIYTGFLSGVLIEAGSITTDKINASVGQELEIGSNKALELFATTDGFRPAGTLHTTDALIDIRAGYTDQSGNEVPAAINIQSGGSLNLQAGTTQDMGGKLNIGSTGELNLSGAVMNLTGSAGMYVKSGSVLDIQANSELTIDSPNFKILKNQDGTYSVTVDGTINADTGNIAGFIIGKTGNRQYIYSGTSTSLTSQNNGVYIGTDGINIGGGAFVFSADGTTSKLKISATDIILGESSTLGSELNTAKTSISGAALSINAQTGNIDVLASNTVNIRSNQAINIITNGTLNIGSQTAPFTIGTDGTRSFIYNNMPTLDSQVTNGIYLGTDGISLGGGKFVVTRNGELTTNKGTISGWEVDSGGIHKGDFYLNRISGTPSSGTIVVQAGSLSGGKYPFSVTSGGVLTANGASIDGTIIAKSLILTNKAVTVDGQTHQFFMKADQDQFKSDYFGSDEGATFRSRTTFLQTNGKLDLQAITETVGGVTKVAGITVDASGNVKLSAANFDSLGSTASGILIEPNKITIGSSGSISIGTGSSAMTINNNGIDLKTSGTLNIDAEHITFTNASLPFSQNPNLLSQLQGINSTIGDFSTGEWSSIAQALNSIKLEVGNKYDQVNGIYITDQGIQFKASAAAESSDVDISANGISIKTGGTISVDCDQLILNGTTPFTGNTLYSQLNGIDNIMGDVSSTGYSSIAQGLTSITSEVSNKYGKVAGIYITLDGIQFKASESASVSDVSISSSGISVKTGGTITVDCDQLLLNGTVPFSGGNSLYAQLNGIKSTMGDLNGTEWSSIVQGLNSISSEVGGKYGKVNGVYITENDISIKSSSSASSSYVTISTDGITINTGSTLTLNGGEIDIGADNFKVDTNGNVYLRSLMILNETTGEYVPVNFSRDFSNAVSYSSGSWSGNTFNATLSFFNGKASKSVKISTSIAIVSAKILDAGQKGQNASGSITTRLTVGGSQKPDDTFTEAVRIDARPAYKDGWNRAQAQYTSAGNRYWGYQDGTGWHVYGSDRMILYTKSPSSDAPS